MSVADVSAIMAASPSTGGGLLGEILHDDGVSTMAASVLEVDASVLDVVLDGSMAPVFETDRPLAVPAAVVAGDPELPDAVTQPADLAQIALASPHVATRTPAGANHLIRDTIGQREPFWSIVSEFLDALE